MSLRLNRVTLVLTLCLAPLSLAAQTVRFSVDQRGDFVLIGNSGAYDCANTPVVPVVGTVGACGTNTGDTSGDVLWRADAPGAGQAQANNTITVANGRTTAMLALPAGATVTYARLYWSAKGALDSSVVLDRPGTFSSTLTSDVTYPAVNASYQASADVTTLVQNNGVGAYRVADLGSDNPINLNDSTFYVGWSMVVFFRLDTMPPRNLTLFDGFDLVNNTTSANVTLTGFVVPDAGFDGKLGIIAYEGDNTLSGEAFTFSGVAVSNALNPANNALNGTRSDLGLPAPRAGDLPQLTGGVGSVSGMDLDVFDVTPTLTAGQTSAPLTATSTGDLFIHGAFITSVSTLKPIFVNVQKTVVDLNGGDVVPGDVLEYVATGTNSGTDTAAGVVLVDVLPAGVTFVPGSINLVSGGIAGVKTDATGDDEGDYVGASRTVTVRLGAGATSAGGGTIPVGGSFEVRLRVTVDAGAPVVINNQIDLATQGVVAVSLGLVTPITYQSDASGSGLRRPTSITVVGDTTIVTQPPLITNANSATFTFASNVGGSTFECSLDGAVFAACPTPVTFSALTEGSHTLQVRYRFGATLDATPASYTWVVDRTAPVPPVVQAPANGSSTNNLRPVISGTAEANSTVTVFIDGVNVGTTVATALGTWAFTPPANLPTGARQVRATATDPAGNTSGTSATNTFTIDVNAPDTGIASGPPVITNSTSATFTFTATEAVLRYECSLDGAAFATCSTPVTFSGLGAGPHSLAVRAVDLAGNVDATPASATWTVDTTAPAAPVVVTPANGSATNNNRPPLSGTAEAGSTVTVFIDGVAVGSTTTSGTGAWTFIPPAALSNASHTVRVTATDGAGNVSPNSNTNTFTVDTVPPGAPVVTAPANGSATNNTRPTITGTAEAGSTVTVIIDGVTAGTTTASSTGAWTFTPPTALAQGSHTASATATDAAGNVAPASNTNTFTVDTAAPSAPVVSAPAEGSSTNNAQPAITGTAEAGSTVTVFIDGVIAGTTLASGTGAWTFTPPTALTEGPHTVASTSTDAAGNASPTSNTNAFTVDTTPPDTTLVSGPTGTVSSSTATFVVSSEPGATFRCNLDGAGFVPCPASSTWPGLADGSHTLVIQAVDAAGNVDPTPLTQVWTVASQDPDTTLTVVPPALTNSTTARAEFTGSGVGFECSLDGAAWTTCTSPFVTTGTLADGLHVLLVRAVNSGGRSDPTPARTSWTVDTSVPAAPVITEPVADTTTGALPRFGGLAEPLSTVTVTINGVTVCTGVTAADGRWSCTATTPLAAGPQVATATVTDGGGNTSMPSLPRAFTVDASKPDTAILTGPAPLTNVTSAQFTVSSDVPAATFECSLDGAAFTACSASPAFTGLADGAHRLEVRAVVNGVADPSPASRVWTQDSVAPTAPVISSPTPNQTTSPTPTVTGTSEPGSTVVVSLDGQPLCTTVASSTGAWSCAGPGGLPPGAHTLSAVATDPAGNPSPASTPLPFTVGSATLDTAIIDGPSGTVRASSATFAFVSTVVGATFECSLDGAAFTACPTPATFASLADGSHTLEVRAVDGANTDSTPAQRTWVIDSSAPPAPTVVTPAAQSTVTTRTPVYSGTAEPGSTVLVSVDDAPACTAIADSTGAWSCTGTVPLADGPHRVAAVAVDGAGNISPASPPHGFVVSLTPVSVSITAPANNTLTQDPRPVISGTATPDATVSVFVDGVLVGTTVADANGAWTLTPTTPLADGTHQITARAELSGVSSPTSDPVTVRIDTRAPVVTITVTQTTPETIPTVTLTSDENPVVYTCSVDGGPFTACASPLDVTGLSPGTHTLVVRGTDAAGNLSEATSTFVIPEPPAASFGIRGGGCGCGATDSPGGLALWVLLLLTLASRRDWGSLRRSSTGPAVILALLTAPLASAQVSQVSGFDLERLDLNPGASASLVSGTGDLLRKGAWRASLVVHYQHDPLVFYRLDTRERVGAVVGSRVTAHLVGAWAPLDWLEVGVQVPVVLWQGGADLSSYGVSAPAATVLGTPWVSGRFGILRERAGAPLDLSVQLGLGLPLGSAAGYSQATPLSFAPRVGVGKTVTNWLRLGAEVGFVVRGAPVVTSAVVQQGTASTFTGAVSATTLGPKLRGELTLRGAMGLDQALAGGELLLGARYPLGKWVEVFALGGPGFGVLPGNPAFRVLAGVAVQPPLEDAPAVAASPVEKPVAAPRCDDSVSTEALRTGCPALDADGDGISNELDACPRVPGVAAARGCPPLDTDHDGLADDVDRCPAEAGAKDRQGCPQKDVDGDGVEDAQDKCPQEAGPVERKGCPLKDGDGDGVEDALDNCPSVKGTVENAGCPAAKRQLVVITADKLVIREAVYFATGKSVVLARSNKLLDNVAEVLLAHPEVPVVRIEGHTDSKGSRAANVALSQARADAVKAQLVQRKVPADRLRAVGFGPAQPTATNDTAAGREQNRRVEFNFEAVIKP
jgi:large repetitive protein